MGISMDIKMEIVHGNTYMIIIYHHDHWDIYWLNHVDFPWEYRDRLGEAMGFSMGFSMASPGMRGMLMGSSIPSWDFHHGMEPRLLPTVTCIAMCILTKYLVRKNGTKDNPSIPK